MGEVDGELPRTSEGHEGPDPRDHTRTGRAGAGPRHLPRRAGIRRVRPGDDPRVGVPPPGQPRAVDRGQDPRQGHPPGRVLRRRGPLGAGRQDPGRPRLQRRRLDVGRVQPVEERGSGLGHTPVTDRRAAQPLPASPPPPRGRRRRPAEAPGIEGAAPRRRRARLTGRPVPGRRRGRHPGHHRHGRRRRLQPAAPDPPQHGPDRRAQGRLGQEDPDGPQPRRERRHLRRPPRRRQRPRDHRRLRPDRRRDRQLPHPLPGQRRRAAQADPGRPRLDLPLRGPGHRLRPLRGAVLPVPHPGAAAAGTGPVLRRGRRPRRAARHRRIDPGHRGHQGPPRPRRAADRPAAGLRLAGAVVPHLQGQPRPELPVLRGGRPPIVIAEYDELCLPHAVLADGTAVGH